LDEKLLEVDQQSVPSMHVIRLKLLTADRRSNSSFCHCYIVKFLPASSARFGFYVCWTS